VKRVLRWLRNGLLGVISLVLVAALAVYAVSERVTRQTFDTPGNSVSIPRDSASAREGERLAQIRGCTGCHGPQLAGDVFISHFTDGEIGELHDYLLARAAAPIASSRGGLR
jgi:hypothetical protein